MEGAAMYRTDNIFQIDYLATYGIEPEYSSFGYSFFRRSALLDELLDRYYITYACVPNRLGK